MTRNTSMRSKPDTRLRTYSKLRRLETLEDRYEYLALRGSVGQPTFGIERYINQRFYASHEWKSIRTEVIIRDNGFDMGLDGWDITGAVSIHHMNPMTVEDIAHGNDDILNPEYLISVSHQTHNAIHYGSKDLLPKPLIQRRPGDTKLW